MSVQNVQKDLKFLKRQKEKQWLLEGYLPRTFSHGLLGLVQEHQLTPRLAFLQVWTLDQQHQHHLSAS